MSKIITPLIIYTQALQQQNGSFHFFPFPSRSREVATTTSVYGVIFNRQNVKISAKKLRILNHGFVDNSVTQTAELLLCRDNTNCDNCCNKCYDLSQCYTDNRFIIAHYAGSCKHSIIINSSRNSVTTICYSYCTIRLMPQGGHITN